VVINLKLRRRTTIWQLRRRPLKKALPKKAARRPLRRDSSFKQETTTTFKWRTSYEALKAL
jgi:hypothetical protein